MKKIIKSLPYILVVYLSLLLFGWLFASLAMSFILWDLQSISIEQFRLLAWVYLVFIIFKVVTNPDDFYNIFDIENDKK